MGETIHSLFQRLVFWFHLLPPPTSIGCVRVAHLLPNQSNFVNNQLADTPPRHLDTAVNLGAAEQGSNL